jgi:ABC-type transport system substrate-binding protein
VKVRPDEWNRFFEDLKARKMSPLYLMGQGNIWFDPYPQIEAFQKSDGFLSTWKDPEIDALLARSNQVPVAGRPEIFGQILKRLSDTTAVVPLYAHLVLYGVRDGVTWKARSDEQVLAMEMTKAGK